MNYKDLNNNLHFLEDESFKHLLPLGCVKITEGEANSIKAAKDAEENSKPKEKPPSLVDAILANPSELAKLKNALK